MSIHKAALLALLTSTLIAPTGVLAADGGGYQNSPDEFMRSCGEIVVDLFADREMSPIIQSPKDSIASTCTCALRQLSTDHKFQKMFADSNSGIQNASEAKRTQAFLMVRYTSVVLACVAAEMDRATNDIGQR